MGFTQKGQIQCPVDDRRLEELSPARLLRRRQRSEATREGAVPRLGNFHAKPSDFFRLPIHRGRIRLRRQRRGRYSQSGNYMSNRGQIHGIAVLSIRRLGGGNACETRVAGGCETHLRAAVRAFSKSLCHADCTRGGPASLRRVPHRIHDPSDQCFRRHRTP